MRRGALLIAATLALAACGEKPAEKKGVRRASRRESVDCMTSFIR